MNYYPHHIGDFNTATIHLTFVERALYRELLDLYYDTEKPLRADVVKLARRVRAVTDEQRAGLAAVLEEFFVLHEDGWRNKQCDTEIAAYHQKQKQQSEAGKASAEKRKAGGNPKTPRDIPTDKGAPAGDGLPAPEKQPATDAERAKNGRSTNQNQNQNQNHTNTPQPPEAGGETAQKLFSFFPEQRRTRLATVSTLIEELVGAGTVTHEQLLAAAAQQAAVLGKDDGKACPSVLRWLRDQRWLDSGIYAPTASGGAWHGLPANWMETRSGVEAMGQLLGLGDWDQQTDRLFSSYENRVVQALQTRGKAPACTA